MTDTMTFPLRTLCIYVYIREYDVVTIKSLIYISPAAPTTVNPAVTV
jgi:hypothetical protein